MDMASPHGWSEPSPKNVPDTNRGYRTFCACSNDCGSP
ncbi:Hypothetical protein A7982_00889 [Minicystis rosea]|nr:Hypothetical protein A7982_00889 [Minicystis rosea]